MHIKTLGFNCAKRKRETTLPKEKKGPRVQRKERN